MSYFLVDDLIAAVGEDIVLRHLSDNNSGHVNEAYLRAIQNRVADMIETRLSRVYSIATLRLDPPPALRSLATDLGLMLMGERKPEFLDANGKSPWSGAGARAMALLKDVQKGDARLDVDGSPAVPANVFGGVRTPSSSGCAPRVTTGFIRNGSGDF